MHVAALAGGVGGSKLLIGLQHALGAGELTAIVNTGDDATIYGLHVSPDIDIVTYWLSGLADVDRGWGIKNDTFAVVEALGRLGQENWFRLGDRDMATCLFRTQRLATGATLSAVTDEIRRSLGVPSAIVPMSDDPVRTTIVAGDGRTLEFQEYFVKERQQPEVKEVVFTGSADAKPAPGVIEAIVEADLVVVCPSNPLVSVGPILGVAGVREALRNHSNVVAVSPIVDGRAIKGPADRMLASAGTEVSALGVARLYADFCNTFVLDRVDAHAREQIEKDQEVQAVALDTMMVTANRSLSLARELLSL